MIKSKIIKFKYMDRHFEIPFCFDRADVHDRIKRSIKENRVGYVCVCDGVVLANCAVNDEYGSIVKRSLLTLCDSRHIPGYIRLLHGDKVEQYAGPDLFWNLVSEMRCRMAFVGSDIKTLDGLRQTFVDAKIPTDGMVFMPLPFCSVDEFDYSSIASVLESHEVDIIWVSLGAPSQEMFMSRLASVLKRGVAISVGAAFKFHSKGSSIKRAPKWMVRNKLEFLHRLIMEPRKQSRRCGLILATLPYVLLREFIRVRCPRLWDVLEGVS